MSSVMFSLMFAALALSLGVAAGIWWQRGQGRRLKRVPAVLRLNARPLFTTEERMLYRDLKAALPNHVVMAKISLLRFCQAAQEREARTWFERLSPVTVGFAVCTPLGAVVSVIDIDTPNKPTSARQQRLKEAVLESCRIRYLRCQGGQWPRPALLAAWVLGSGVAGGAPTLAQARTELAQKLQQRRVERASRFPGFQDSAFAGDSFFAHDSQFDLAANSGPMPLESTQRAATRALFAPPASAVR